MSKYDKKKKAGPVPHKVLSNRGIHLEKAHQRQQGSNVNYGEPIVIEQDDKGKDIVVTVGQRCPVCKKRIRGLNHVEGAHHTGNVPKHSHR